MEGDLRYYAISGVLAPTHVAETDGNHSTGHFATALMQSSCHSPDAHPANNAVPNAREAMVVCAWAMAHPGTVSTVAILCRSPVLLWFVGRGRTRTNNHVLDADQTLDPVPDNRLSYHVTINTARACSPASVLELVVFTLLFNPLHDSVACSGSCRASFASLATCAS